MVTFLQTLYNNTNSYVTVCHGAIAKVKDIDPTTRSTLEGALCIETVTTAVNQMVATIGTQDSQKKVFHVKIVCCQCVLYLHTLQILFLVN